MTEAAIPPEERPFLDAILANPDDDEPRLVYADWLEERGDHRAKYLRTEVEYRRLTPGRSQKHQELHAALGRARGPCHAGWIALIARTPIEYCPVASEEIELEFECPLRWESLRETSIPIERHCESCAKTVYFCRTIEKARDHVARGHCVAVDTSLSRLRPSGDLGRPIRMGRALPEPHHPQLKIRPIPGPLRTEGENSGGDT